MVIIHIKSETYETNYSVPRNVVKQIITLLDGKGNIFHNRITDYG